MYLHKELETLTRPEIEKLQLERLQKTVRHCMNSPFYKQRFAENHLSPEDIRSLDDLQKIPFTTKQDLRDTYPFGLASVPLEKTVRLHSSSGTTGNPTVILHTQKDLDEWANAVARCLYMVGLRPGDIFQNSSGYGMFTGGLGFQYGAERQCYKSLIHFVHKSRIIRCAVPRFPEQPKRRKSYNHSIQFAFF